MTDKLHLNIFNYFAAIRNDKQKRPLSRSKFLMGRVMAETLNLLRLRYKFIFCTRQTTAHSSPCLSWESFPTDKTLFCVGSIFLNQHNKKADNKSYQLFYGAGNVVVLETISHLLKVVKSEEYQWVEFNLQKLIA